MAQNTGPDRDKVAAQTADLVLTLRRRLAADAQRVERAQRAMVEAVAAAREARDLHAATAASLALLRDVCLHVGILTEQELSETDRIYEETYRAT